MSFITLLTLPAGVMRNWFKDPIKNDHLGDRVMLKLIWIHVKVFMVMMLCSVVVGYQHFIGPCCLHLQGEV